MRLKLYIFALIFSTFPIRAFCQQSDLEWFISPNANLYIPINNPVKGVYPILWYDKETDPKVLIGGFGIGVSALKHISENVYLKGQANLSKYTYWDEPITMVDENGNPLRPFLAGSSDYSLGITATTHYFLTKKISVGTGLGGQILLMSLSRLPKIEGPVLVSKGGIVGNRYYKPFIPVLPVELSLKLEKLLFNIRYEHGLLNRLKGELGSNKKDKFSLLVFEIGFRVK